MGSGRIWRALAAGVLLLTTSGCALGRSGGLFDDSPAVGGACERIPLEAGGPEDIAIDPAGGFWVSASDWRGRQKGDAIGRGAIYRLRFDPATGAAVRQDVTPAEPADFQPHGVDLWTSPSGERRLFVVNHPVDGPSRVEVFAVDGDRLRPTGQTWVFRKVLHRPNDVAAFGPASFFATNDHAVRRERWFRPSLWEFFQDVSGWRGGSVVRVRDGRAEVVAKGLALANGIALDRQGRRLFVAESTAAAVRVYEDLEAPRLKLAGVRRVGPGPDNLNRDAAGRFWLGGHNNGLAFLRHVRDPGEPSPGRVAVLDPDAAGPPKVVYQSGKKDLERGGRGLSAVSVGAPDGADAVVVGNIFTPALERCAVGGPEAVRLPRMSASRPG